MKLRWHYSRRNHNRISLKPNSTIYQVRSPMFYYWQSKSNYKWNIVWRNVIILLYYHVSAVYGAYLIFTVAKWYTIIFCKFFNFKFSLLSIFTQSVNITNSSMIKIIYSHSVNLLVSPYLLWFLFIDEYPKSNYIIK